MSGARRQQDTIKKALEVNRADPAQPLDVLRKVGGLEIAAITGIILGVLERVEGVIVLVADEVGMDLVPATREGRIFSDLNGLANQRLADQPIVFIMFYVGFQ
ncbi:MAG: bifunctional adenosylcobinamide kinase/adenosylcobinamide-phosphate guanylyltransferase [Bacillota bacterium]|nr:bifunctional adenosylcobinamide kinase/adenosylcobinamide-phosphate guanylyltransferase [Bacillota bacterium]